MKVLIINGSPRVGGNSSKLIENLVETFNSLNVEAKVMQIGNKEVRGCMACGYCKKNNGECVFKDSVNEAHSYLKEADGLILVSPVYYASPNGSIISFLDRLFFSSNYSFKMKVGASFAVARRAGTVASFDVLNKYFTIAGMPIASGDYWNNGFGREKGQIEADLEGLRNARVVAKRMVFLMQAISDAKGKYSNLLEDEEKVMTSFIK